MRTIKLVVIGSSGVGKTSLRGKYISGRFSAGYRATIGADFITKTLPHPNDATQSITLQIWDTAGQERFSSLSTAFFRGADAAILMFDVNDASTMVATKKWWADFCEKAPVADEDVAEYCCVLVGNKIDIVADKNDDGSGGGGGGWNVSESEALAFLDGLVAPQEEQTTMDVAPPSSISNGHVQAVLEEEEEADPRPRAEEEPRLIAHSREPSHSPRHHLSKSHSRSRSPSRFYAGTMTSAHTALTIYHTPSLSLFDDDGTAHRRGASSSIYQSARSSAAPPAKQQQQQQPWSHSSPDLTLRTSPHRRRRSTIVSRGSTGSDTTITPGLFEPSTIENRNGSGGGGGLLSSHSSPDLSSFLSQRRWHDHDQQQHPVQSKYPHRTPPPPERGPRLLFTSAKTGEGVSELFEYVARRVVRKWEYDDWLDARSMRFRDAAAATASGEEGAVRLLLMRGDDRMGGCC